MPHYYFDIQDGQRIAEPSGSDLKNDDAAIAKAKVIAIGVSLDKPAVDPKRHIAVLNGSREEIFRVPVYSKPSMSTMSPSAISIGLRPRGSLRCGRTQWHEKYSRRATIRRTCAPSAAIRNVTDFQCGGSAWRLHY